MCNNSPLEYLAGFAVAFMTGVVTTVGIQQWTKFVKNQATKIQS